MRFVFEITNQRKYEQVQKWISQGGEQRGENGGISFSCPRESELQKYSQFSLLDDRREKRRPDIWGKGKKHGGRE